MSAIPENEVKKRARKAEIESREHKAEGQLPGSTIRETPRGIMDLL